MNISGPAAVAKPEMLFYAPGDLTVTLKRRKAAIFDLYRDISLWHSSEIFLDVHFTASFKATPHKSILVLRNVI